MFQFRTIRTLLVGLLALVIARTSRAEEVPEWFRFDPAKPYAIFDAWKELSTRKAMVCCGENWKALAGRLVNKRGEPLANCPIEIVLVPWKAWSAKLQTDKDGYFIIYSPWELDLDSGARTGGPSYIVARPGFPATQVGEAFADKFIPGGRICRATPIARDDERAFYVLTCDDQAGFNADEFEEFQQKYFAQKFEREAWRDKPSGSVHKYDVRVVDAAGSAVRGVLVKWASVPSFQIWDIDKERHDVLAQWPPADGDHSNRFLTVDSPEFDFGPDPSDQKSSVKVIRLSRPAVVEGKIVDDLGNPLACELTVRYRRLSITFTTRFYSERDGSFRCDRVMPEEEFRIVRDSQLHGYRWAATASDWMSLRAEETRNEVNLKLSLAAGLRGTVVSENGTLVPGGASLDFGPRDGNPLIEMRHYVGTDNGPWGPKDGRFGFDSLDSRPFRIAPWRGVVEPSEPIQLEPGEMRFIKVTLKRKLANPN